MKLLSVEPKLELWFSLDGSLSFRLCSLERAVNMLNRWAKAFAFVRIKSKRPPLLAVACDKIAKSLDKASFALSR